MLMEKGMDTGPILSSKSINIHTSDTSKTIHDKLSNLSLVLATNIKLYPLFARSFEISSPIPEVAPVTKA